MESFFNQPFFDVGFRMNLCKPATSDWRHHFRVDPLASGLTIGYNLVRHKDFELPIEISPGPTVAGL